MDLARLQIATAAQLLCDIGRNIPRPAFGCVEADDADGLRILPVEQVLDDGLEVRGLDVGFAVGATLSYRAQAPGRAPGKLRPSFRAAPLARNRMPRGPPHLLAALFESLARFFFEGIRMVGSKGLSSVPSCPFSSNKPRDTPRVQFSKWMD